jgi:pyruvate dehydrogenase complex dehydrogenase (E1) component
MINIPNRNEKLKSQIIDAFRIIAWQEYKNSYEGELKGLELYEKFKEEWLAHEIQKMTFAQIKKFMEKHEYTLSDISQIRTEYYQQRKEYQAMVSYSQFSNHKAQESNDNLDNPPF